MRFLFSFIKHPVVFISCGCIAVFLFWFGYNAFDLPGDAPSNEGEFGDKFGALNTLFTGFAFVGLVGTLWYQIAENQKREAETLAFKQSLQRTADALEHQAMVAERDQYLTALVARIDGYKFQISLKRGTPMEAELDNLLWELSDVLAKARGPGGGKVVTSDEKNARIKEAALHKSLGEFIKPEK